MKITILAVGKIKEQYLKDAINEYAKRLSRFCDLNIVEIDETSLQVENDSNIKKALDTEGSLIEKKITDTKRWVLKRIYKHLARLTMMKMKMSYYFY